MESRHFNRRVAIDIGFAVFIVAASAAFLILSLDLPAMSAILPVAMLSAMIGLGILLIVTQYLRRDSLEDNLDFGKPSRVIGAFAAIVVYALAVQFLGFYLSTIVMILVVAWAFGYRKWFGLALATAIFVGGIYLIFSILMGQRFPEEFFLR